MPTSDGLQVSQDELTLEGGTMQSYGDFAAKHGLVLDDVGPCTFCGAVLDRSVNECMEIFELGFGGLNLTAPQDNVFRFFIVDAHALQHPELHGRWSSHFTWPAL